MWYHDVTKRIQDGIPASCLVKTVPFDYGLEAHFTVTAGQRRWPMELDRNSRYEQKVTDFIKTINTALG